MKTSNNKTKSGLQIIVCNFVSVFHCLRSTSGVRQSKASPDHSCRDGSPEDHQSGCETSSAQTQHTYCTSPLQDFPRLVLSTDKVLLQGAEATSGVRRLRSPWTPIHCQLPRPSGHFASLSVLAVFQPPPATPQCTPPPSFAWYTRPHAPYFTDDNSTKLMRVSGGWWRVHGAPYL